MVRLVPDLSAGNFAGAWGCASCSRFFFNEREPACRGSIVSADAEAIFEPLEQAHVDLAHARFRDAHHLPDLAH